MTSASIFGVIVDKLSYRKKLCLVILFKVNKDPKIGFYHAVLSFGLAVRLWIEDNKESLLNA